MSLAQMLQQSGAIDSMARELNVDRSTAQTAAGALLPAIVAGMGRTSSGSTGLGGLGSVIGSLGGGGLLESVLGAGATETGKGNDILGTIFGGKETSRGVASEVSAITGIDEGVLKKMLPILAMAVVGYLRNQSQAGGSAGRAGAGASPAGPLGGALGGILGQVVSGMTRR